VERQRQAPHRLPTSVSHQRSLQLVDALEECPQIHRSVLSSHRSTNCALNRIVQGGCEGRILSARKREVITCLRDEFCRHFCGLRSRIAHFLRFTCPKRTHGSRMLKTSTSSSPRKLGDGLVASESRLRCSHVSTDRPPTAEIGVEANASAMINEVVVVVS
jgi:hypothetical protein